MKKQAVSRLATQSHLSFVDRSRSVGVLTDGAWFRTDKGDWRTRVLADGHYTRQTPGHPMWTRPGYNLVLYNRYENGAALFCWWRPKWEDGVARKDGLHVLECTMFRCVGETELASELIRAAVLALSSEDARRDLWLHRAGPIERLITGVGSAATARRRSKHRKPGACFRSAGWTEFEKRGGRADVWLEHAWRNPFVEGPA